MVESIEFYLTCWPAGIRGAFSFGASDGERERARTARGDGDDNAL